MKGKKRKTTQGVRRSTPDEYLVWTARSDDPRDLANAWKDFGKRYSKPLIGWCAACTNTVTPGKAAEAVRITVKEKSMWGLLCEPCAGEADTEAVARRILEHAGVSDLRMLAAHDFHAGGRA